MAANARNSLLNLYSTINRMRGGNSDAIQQFFDDNDIDIDLQTHNGFDKILKIGGGRNGWDTNGPGFYFEEKDMTDMISGAHGKQFYVAQLADFLTGKSRNNVRVFVYKRGETVPRELKYDKENGRLEISQKVTETEMFTNPPARPQWWKRVAHWFSASNYETDFRNYHDALNKYNACKEFMKNPMRGRQARWREENQKNFAQQEVMDASARGSNLSKVTNQIGEGLGAFYGKAEKLNDGKLCRLDFITIEGRPLRRVIADEGWSGSEGPVTDETKINSKTAMDMKEHINEVILAALLRGKKVEVCAVNNETGTPVVKDGALVTDVLPVPERLKALKERDMEKGEANISALYRLTKEKVKIDFDWSAPKPQQGEPAEEQEKEIQAQNNNPMLNI